MALASFSLSLQAGSALPEPLDFWKTKVEPLLDRNCWKCHAGVHQKGGLDLRSPQTILRGGDNGPAIVPGDAARSLLHEVLQPGSDSEMPPEKAKKLTREEIEVVRQWIDLLPKAENVPTTASPTNAAWASAYLADIQKTVQPRWTPPADMAASDVIDRFIELGWEDRKVKASAVCDDATFVRRVYLDLAGRIPTQEEAAQFLQNPSKNKRAELADALLAGNEYPRRMREVFDVVLLSRPQRNEENQRKNNQWWAYLESAFRENRPWNKVVKEVILARPERPQDKGAVWFLYEQKNNHQAMAESIAPVVFGTQVACAQCHNHPLAYEIEQRHYWALVAAFNRSKNVDTPQGPGVAESAIGGFISFANLRKESQPARLTFQNGREVAEVRPADDVKEKDEPEMYLIAPSDASKKPSVPKFSRREQFAASVTDDNPMLARAFANRMWALLAGRGLTHPVDQIDSKHPASHPDMLEWMGRHFAKSGYDVKRLAREIVLSKTYQLDSRPAGEVAPFPDAFATGLEKPLSAEQLFRSALVAMGLPAAKADDDSLNDLRKAFISNFPDLFAIEYNATLHQAMFLSNSPLIDELVQPKDNNLTAQMLQLSEPAQRIEKAFRSILGRAPSAEEAQEAKNYLQSRKPETGAAQLVWALLTGSEFQVNH